MTRAAGAAGSAVLGAVTLALGGAPPTVDAARAPAARVQVVAREHSLALSRATLRAGPVVVELVNLGEDDHDLALRRLGGGATRRLARTAPGAIADLETTLRSGRYRLWCTLGDHRARGMVATLVVRAAPTSGRPRAAAASRVG